MQCLLILVIWPIYFEMKVVVLVGVFLMLQIGLLVLHNLAMSSELLHVIGAALGFPVAIWMLKAGMVDCENWDIFSVWKGDHTISSDERELAEARAVPANLDDNDRLPTDLLLEQLRQILRAGQPLLALKAHQRMSQTMPGWILPRADLWNLIQALHGQKQWADSVPLMEEYLAHYPQQAALVRLKLAHILLTEEGRPDKALNVIAQIERSALDARQNDLLDKIRARAESLLGRS